MHDSGDVLWCQGCGVAWAALCVSGPAFETPATLSKMPPHAGAVRARELKLGVRVWDHMEPPAFTRALAEDVDGIVVRLAWAQEHLETHGADLKFECPSAGTLDVEANHLFSCPHCTAAAASRVFDTEERCAFLLRLCGLEAGDADAAARRDIAAAGTGSAALKVTIRERWGEGGTRRKRRR